MNNYDHVLIAFILLYFHRFDSNIHYKDIVKKKIKLKIPSILTYN